MNFISDIKGGNYVFWQLQETCEGEEFDVVIIGGGMVGAAVGCGLGKRWFVFKRLTVAVFLMWVA